MTQAVTWVLVTALLVVLFVALIAPTISGIGKALP